MLNILVCVKQVPDVNLVKIDPVTGSLIRAGVPAILNPLDGNALEAAVRTKEKYGGTVTVITMGPDQAAEALRECLAAGADRAVLLSDRAFANADTLATSYVIVTAAKLLGKYDLIFCGKESLDGATGQMASQLAERFDASQLSSVCTVLEVDEKRTDRHRRAGARGRDRDGAGAAALPDDGGENELPSAHPQPQKLEGLAHGADRKIHVRHHPRARPRADRRSRLADEGAAHLPAREGPRRRDDPRGQRRQGRREAAFAACRQAVREVARHE